MLLLIDNYDSFTWNLVHYFGELGAEMRVERNDALSVEDALALKPQAVVLSPGPCTPREAGICVELIRQAPADLPIMGVCLGHQAIGEAFGGDVIRCHEIMHGKLSTITHDGTGLFEGLPQGFEVTRYHSLTVKPETLPDCLHVTARSQSGVIMGLAHRSRPVHGVQFHPESIASEHGHAMIANFLRLAGLPAGGRRAA
ncbi:aminodeoxychorismate/anthranilate synthase component II [Limibaculum sp. M0105]|uniref:Aminodeoxychorismate/anthranilate synthase component II n=1 Tax=Thermohalobaculum xanthum TaxID=2753746 RepID=A0A8J7M781_9RHOB|nr:aminodeoxychorismate/anthranilate synthase component II [Thermohalobaculum xanthum]MBK0398814.1 aminodeoxychorismate/anthranilate synthase component II [Thermohalobaculum xanthum]